MGTNLAGFGSVFPHKATDGARSGRFWLRLSAQGHRWGPILGRFRLRLSAQRHRWGPIWLVSAPSFEIVRRGESFAVVDIAGLKWVEMDNHEDYQQAQEFFGGN